jgi:hypothetical protein
MIRNGFDALQYLEVYSRQLRLPLKRVYYPRMRVNFDGFKSGLSFLRNARSRQLHQITNSPAEKVGVKYP